MSNFENHVQRDLVRDAVFTEVNEEFILPDYMPEIGRVLRVCACLLPDEPFLGNEGADFSGRLEYRLLYSDSEGVITEAPLEGRYRYRVPYGGEPVGTLYTEEELETVAARPTAPRKLTVRARVKARPHLLTEETVGVTLSALIGDAPAETRKSVFPVTDRAALSLGAQRVEERFTVEGTLPEALSLISVRADPLIERAEVREGYVSVGGRLIVTLLLARAAERPFVKTCSIPFEEEIPCEEGREGDALTLRAFTGAPTVSFEEEGEGTAVLLDCEYTLSGILYKEREITLLDDVYVHGAFHSIERRPFTAERLLGCAMGNVTINGDVPIPNEHVREGDCLLPYFRLRELSASLLDQRAVLEGTITVILLSLGEKGGDAAELTLPFRAELATGARAEKDALLRACATPLGGTAHVSGGVLHLSTELSLSAAVLCEEARAVPVAAVKTGEAAPIKASTLTVYYPTDGDTLWSVGKKYALPIATIKAQNGFPENGEPDGEESDSLDGYAYLLLEGL